MTIYQLTINSVGTLNTARIFYEQPFASASSTLNQTVPCVPGFSTRLDTGALFLVDEQTGSIWVLLCTTYNYYDSSNKACLTGPSHTTAYGTSYYRDIEFIGASASKMFITSLRDPSNARA